MPKNRVIVAVDEVSDLHDAPSVELYCNVVATETLALFDHLYFELLQKSDVFALAKEGEYESTSHQNSSAASCIAIQGNRWHPSCCTRTLQYPDKEDVQPLQAEDILESIESHSDVGIDK